MGVKDYRTKNHAIRNELQIITGMAQLLKIRIADPHDFEFAEKVECCDDILTAALKIAELLTEEGD